MQHLKLPPYGKPLKDLIDKRFKPDNSIFLYIGREAWDRARKKLISHPNNVLVLPPYNCPTLYDWPVKQCDVLIIDCGYPEQDYIDDLVFCLYNADAEVVRYISPDHKLTVYQTHKE